MSVPSKPSTAACRYAASSGAARNAWGVCTAASPGGRAAVGVRGDHARDRRDRDRAAVPRGRPPGSPRRGPVPASGRAASWIATTSTTPASMSAAQRRTTACHSDWCRVAPPWTTTTSRSPSSGARAAAIGCLLAGTRPRRPGGVRRRRPSASRTDQATTGRSAERAAAPCCTPAPTRVPEPAARITTAALTPRGYPRRGGRRFHGCYTTKRAHNTAALASRSSERTGR